MLDLDESPGDANGKPKKDSKTPSKQVIRPGWVITHFLNK